MKKYIAKFFKWCLYKLGYTETYSRKHEIKIYVTTDADEAIKKIKLLLYETEKLIEAQNKVKK